MNTRLQFSTACIMLLCGIWSFSAAEAAVWIPRNTSTTHNLTAIASSGGEFFGAGEAATLVRTPSGISWTASTITEAGGAGFRAAAFAQGRHVLGGSGSSLLRWSTDGVQWTNAVTGVGAQAINGICFQYGMWVAVGEGETPNSSLILVSSNGVDWISRPNPATNELFAVQAAVMPSGLGWASPMFAAVGNNGTIVTSPDGLSWTLAASVTTAPLRAITFHNMKFFAGGDFGTVIYSSNGSTWIHAAPSDINIRGMASSGDLLAIVGNYLTEGRVHWSVDGLTWPGNSEQFQSALNAVVYNGVFVAVGANGIGIQSTFPTAGGVNSWIKPTSGAWDDAGAWSLAVRPAADQAAVMITNAGWKAVAINPTTGVQFPESLIVKTLTVEAPVDSLNELLLNYSSPDHPLTVMGNLWLGSNSRLVGYYSGLNASNISARAQIALTDSRLSVTNDFLLGNLGPAELNLTNTTAILDRVIVGLTSQSVLNQNGGDTRLTNLVFGADSMGIFTAGTVRGRTLDLQAISDFPIGYGWQTRPGIATVWNSSSLNEFATLRMGVTGNVASGLAGVYQLDGGQLNVGSVQLYNGFISQTGGTVLCGDLMMPPTEAGDARYYLASGKLTTTDISVGRESLGSPGHGWFEQSGGVHTNTTLLVRGEIRKASVTARGYYNLHDGLLISAATTLRGGRFNQFGGTNQVQQLSLTEAGYYILTNGFLITSNTSVSTIVCVEARFLQSGGRHEAGKLLLEELIQYELTGGSLLANEIEIGRGARLILRGGQVFNPGQVTLRRGALILPGQAQQFGRLQVVAETNGYFCNALQVQSATINFGQSFAPLDGAGPSIARFQDSSTIPWSAPLDILYWCPANVSGPDHIFFGSNAQGLSAAQLAQVRFVNPIGWAEGSYPARILSSGELVPAVPPQLTYNAGTGSGSLVLSWAGDYSLVSATNALGPYLPVPGASSPWTNTLFSDPKRFFTLH